ncbi:hypothetical protein AVEN_89439-1 [Araneus ventricosus]|uniref:Uncharacterized protein n=1 Tax=Araneus ventricosus TaxID=182803 RepID=A0A4Y2VR96_ARAVE|nr:hypothetical protein AVEN_34951-1 [Araneus ventricosus]GBO40899.1 hypothetical protein AVEN_89439-1 [Araneus ventricosus]
MSRHLSSEPTSFNADSNLSEATELPTKDKYFLATKNRRRWQTKCFNSIVFAGNQSIGQYLSVHYDPFSNPPINRRLEEAVVGDRPKVLKFKAL